MTREHAGPPSGRAGLGQRLVSNTLHAASGRVVAMLVWVFYTPAILSSLGAERFAIWALFYAVTGYLGALDLGFAQSTLRHVALTRERSGEAEAGAHATLGVMGYVVLGALWLSLVMGLHERALAWLRIPTPVLGDATFALVASACVFTVAGIANVTLAVLQACGRFDLANGCMLLGSVGQIVGFTIALRSGLGLPGLVVAVLASWLLISIGGCLFIARAVRGFRWATPRAASSRLRELLRFGGPMQATNSLAILHQHLDKLLLPRLATLALVAPLELGSRVAAAVTSLPQLLLLAVLPEATRLHAAADPAGLHVLYARGSRYVMTATAVLLVPLLACPERLFIVWLGARQPDAARVLLGFALAAWVSLATGMASTITRALGRTELETWFAGATLGLHLALSLWWIPLAGLTGAVLAFVVSVSFGALVFLVLVARALRWRVLQILSPAGIPALATGLGALAGYGLDRWTPSLRGPAGWAALAGLGAGASLVTLGVLLAARYLSWSDLTRLAAPWSSARRAGT